MVSSNQLEKFLGHWHSAKSGKERNGGLFDDTAGKCMKFKTGRTPEILHTVAACHRKRKFLALSIEGAALSIQSTPFYRLAGFLGIFKKCSASIESANS